MTEGVWPAILNCFNRMLYITHNSIHVDGHLDSVEWNSGIPFPWTRLTLNCNSEYLDVGRCARWSDDICLATTHASVLYMHLPFLLYTSS